MCIAIPLGKTTTLELGLVGLTGRARLGRQLATALLMLLRLLLVVGGVGTWMGAGGMAFGSLFPVCTGSGRERFFSAWALAAEFAVTVKAVCGTRRGMRGTRRRPSILHSELTSLLPILSAIVESFSSLVARLTSAR